MLMTAMADMCPTITELALEEPARFNPERLEELCVRIGEVRAEAEVALALQRISELLPSLDRVLLIDADAFVMGIRQISQDAELIGMATLARVACDVLDCYFSGNEVALAATLARLERVGERSIHAVWDLDDLAD